MATTQQDIADLISFLETQDCPPLRFYANGTVCIGPEGWDEVRSSIFPDVTPKNQNDVLQVGVWSNLSDLPPLTIQTLFSSPGWTGPFTDNANTKYYLSENGAFGEELLDIDQVQNSFLGRYLFESGIFFLKRVTATPEPPPVLPPFRQILTGGYYLQKSGGVWTYQFFSSNAYERLPTGVIVGTPTPVTESGVFYLDCPLTDTQGLSQYIAGTPGYDTTDTATVYADVSICAKFQSNLLRFSFFQTSTGTFIDPATLGNGPLITGLIVGTL